MDGDQVNEKGALSGGYLDTRRSRLQAQLDIERLNQQASDYTKQQVPPSLLATLLHLCQTSDTFCDLFFRLN